MIEVFEIWIWRRIEIVQCVGRVTNKAVLTRLKGKNTPDYNPEEARKLDTVIEKQSNVNDCFEDKTKVEERKEETEGHGRYLCSGLASRHKTVEWSNDD